MGESTEREYGNDVMIQKESYKVGARRRDGGRIGRTEEKELVARRKLGLVGVN